jgi:hypothetical protein
VGWLAQPLDCGPVDDWVHGVGKIDQTLFFSDQCELFWRLEAHYRIAGYLNRSWKNYRCNPPP